MATIKEKVAQYLVDRINLDNYKDCDWVRKDDEIMAIRDIIKMEKKDEWNDRNQVPAVKNWLLGNPSAFECSTKPFRRRQLILEWTSMSKKFLNENDETFLADLYYTRLAMEFIYYWKKFDKGRIVNPPVKTVKEENK